MKASEAETRALDEADALLRFAAERVQDLDPDLSLAVAESRVAFDNDRWTPQTAQRFWTAFARLCELVAPVSTDSLAEGRQRVPAFRWIPWGHAEETTVAARSSARYLRMMIVLLLIILPLQLYLWIGTNLSKEIGTLLSAVRPKIAQLSQDADQLRPAPKAPAPVDQQAEEAADQQDEAGEERAKAIVRRAKVLNGDLDRILESVTKLERVTTFARTRSIDPGLVTESAEGLDRAGEVRTVFNQLQWDSGPIIERANLLTGIVGSFILPVLFGMIGAVAYI